MKPQEWLEDKFPDNAEFLGELLEIMDVLREIYEHSEKLPLDDLEEALADEDEDWLEELEEEIHTFVFHWEEVQILEEGDRVYRFMGVDDSSDVIAAIEEEGDTGDYWAYNIEGADQYVGEGEEDFLIEAVIPSDVQIDYLGTALQNCAYENEYEIIFFHGDLEITKFVVNQYEFIKPREGTRATFEPGGDNGSSEYPKYARHVREHGNPHFRGYQETFHEYAQSKRSEKEQDEKRGGDVEVSAYTKKDGTKVKSHTRSAPGDFDCALDELPFSVQVKYLVDRTVESLQEGNPELDFLDALREAYRIVRETHPLTEDFIPRYIGVEVRDDQAAAPAHMRPYRRSYQRPLRPLSQAATGGKSSSSNVAAIGYDKGVMYVKFHNGALYSYDVGPKVYEIIASAPSKGQAVWSLLRGWDPGRVIDDPSKTTPGGVGGSKVVYWKVSHQPGRDAPAMSPEAMRRTIAQFTQFHAAPAPDPEGALKPPTATQSRGNVAIGQLSGREIRRARELEEEAKKILLRAQEEKEEAPTPEEADRGLGQRRKALQQRIEELQAALSAGTDLPDVVRQTMQREIKRLQRQLRSDYTDDFTLVSDTTLHGPITRAGAFRYGSTVKEKDWNNLREVFSRLTHVPAFDSHEEHRLIGYAHGPFKFNEDTHQILGNLETFQDIEEISPLSDEERERFPVSIRFYDGSRVEDRKQDIREVLHLAVSLDKTDRDRCSTEDGAPCYVSPVASLDDFQQPTQEDYSMPENTKENDKDKKKKKDEDEEDEDDEDKEKKEDKKDMEDAFADFLEVYGYPNKEEFFRVYGVNKSDMETLRDENARLRAKIEEHGDFIAQLRAQEEKRREERAGELREKLAEHPSLKADFLNGKGLEELEELDQNLIWPASRGSADDFEHLDGQALLSRIKKTEQDFRASMKGPRTYLAGGGNK